MSEKVTTREAIASKNLGTVSGDLYLFLYPNFRGEWGFNKKFGRNPYFHFFLDVCIFVYD